MSMVNPSNSTSNDIASYGGFLDALGGIATVVLAIIGLAGVKPDILVSIATVVFGVALLIQAGAMLTEFALIGNLPETQSSSSGGLSALFLAGCSGILLGLLALLGLYAAILTAISVIAFGAALIISSSTVQLLSSCSVATRRSPGSSMLQVMTSELASGSAGLQAMAGLAMIVIGVLAAAGVFSESLTLIAFLVAGGAIVLTGSTLSAAMRGFMRPVGASTQHIVATRVDIELYE